MAEEIQVKNGSGASVTAEAENLVTNAAASADTSDVTLTVPTGKVWTLKQIAVQLITNATVGARLMRIDITDGTNVVWRKAFGVAAGQTASLTRQYLAASDYLADDTAFDANGNARIAMQQWTLPAGWKIRIYDSAAIDNVADADNIVIFCVLVDQRTEGTKV